MSLDRQGLHERWLKMGEYFWKFDYYGIVHGRLLCTILRSGGVSNVRFEDSHLPRNRDNNYLRLFLPRPFLPSATVQQPSLLLVVTSWCALYRRLCPRLDSLAISDPSPPPYPPRVIHLKPPRRFRRRLPTAQCAIAKLFTPNRRA